jgi:putative transposase
MSYVKNWLHCVWGTKNRTHFLTDEIRKDLIRHIRENARIKNIYIDSIDGSSDHLHCLISLNPDLALSKVIQLIKGESSFWMNKNKKSKERFAWAVEYYAVSLSVSDVRTVRRYIKNQKEHHMKDSWEKELNEYMKSSGFNEYQG